MDDASGGLRGLGADEGEVATRRVLHDDGPQKRSCSTNRIPPVVAAVSLISVGPVIARLLRPAASCDGERRYSHDDPGDAAMRPHTPTIRMHSVPQLWQPAVRLFLRALDAASRLGRAGATQSRNSRAVFRQSRSGLGIAVTTLGKVSRRDADRPAQRELRDLPSGRRIHACEHPPGDTVPRLRGGRRWAASRGRHVLRRRAGALIRV